jgi:hypothetical protein
MSASIHYRNASKADPTLSVDAPSSFIEALEKAFGYLPIVLSSAHVGMLKGLAINGRGEHGYDDLIEKIEKFGSVEVYASW